MLKRKNEDMYTGMLWLFVCIYFSSETLGLTLEPSPTANCQRYKACVFNCTIFIEWASVAFDLEALNIAFLTNTDNSCQNQAETILYQASCDYSSRKFYLTIKNVTDESSGKKITCRVNNQEKLKKTTINVQHPPILPLSITQFPDQPVVAGNKVTLTCTIVGGNPLASIVWQCNGFSSVTPTSAPSTGEVVSSIERNVTKDDNGKTCICKGTHVLWDIEMEENHTLNVYFKPTKPPSIVQTPPGPVNVSDTIILSCEIEGGNPLAVILWQCEGAQTVSSTGNPPIGKSVSKIELTVTKDHNGDLCICNGSHPTWKPNEIASVTLNVRYPPTLPLSITQFPDRPVVAGNKVTLTCKIVGGNPLATIVWQCIGFSRVTPTSTPPSGEVSSSIERTVTEQDNERTCICKGTHVLWNIEMEENHTLNVYFEPTTHPLIEQTPPGPVNVSDTITLSCEVEGGNPLAVISWQCEGAQTVSSTGNSPIGKSVSKIQLTVTKDHNEDVCICNGSHPTWKPNKVARVTLDVRYAPEMNPLIMQTPPGHVIEGNKVILTCRISGGNPLSTIVWQCGGFNVVSTTPPPSAEEVAVSINGSVVKDDDGKECICTGHHLLWSHDKKVHHTLNVFYATTIRIANVNPINLVQNDSIILVCEEMDGNPRNASFRWYHDNSFISTTANYSITKANVNNSGNYSCKGSNAIGIDSVAKVEVNVLYPPIVSVVSESNVDTIGENGTATFKCDVQCYPPPNITWTRHGSSRPLDSIDNNYQSYFTIRLATCFHTGNYTCRATNSINGEEYSSKHDIALFVTCSPRLYNLEEGSPTTKGLAVGQNLTLSEHILAYPKVHVSWLFQQSENSSKGIKSALICSAYNVIEHFICFIRLNLTETDFGMYSAVVANDIGNATFTYIVNPQGPPDQSHNVNVTCGVQRAEIIWLTGFNGGQEQTFYIMITDSIGRVRMQNTGLVGNKKGERKLYPLVIEAGRFRFDVFGNNTFGNATLIGVYCDVQGLDEKDSVVGLAAGLGSGSAVIAIIIIAVVVVFRKRRERKKEDDTKLFKRSEKRINEDDDDGLKENPLYITSGESSNADIGPVYGVVNKQKQNMKNIAVVENIDQGPVYSLVQKTNTQGKKKGKKKKEKNTTQTKNHTDIELGTVYENSDKLVKLGSSDELYANAGEQGKGVNLAKVYNPKKNKDGLIYADLDLIPGPSGKTFVIRGSENKTNYAIIDLSIKVDPLPSDDENDDNDNTRNKSTVDTNDG